MDRPLSTVVPECGRGREAALSVFEKRHDQMFPVLSAAQIDVARRFASGPPRRFEPGAVMVEVGELAAPVWLVLAGSIEVAWRDGLGRETAVERRRPGSVLRRDQPARVAHLARGGTRRPRGLHRHSVRLGPSAGSHHRLGGYRRDRDARLHPAPGRADRRRPLRLDPDRARRHAGRRAAARLPDPQRLSRLHPGARATIPKRMRWSSGWAFARTSSRCCSAPTAPCCAGPPMKRRADAWASRPGSIPAGSTTWRWSAPVLPGSPPPSTPPPKASRCWCSTSAPSAARPAPRPASRTTSVSPPASPARPWPGAPIPRRRSSAPSSPSRSRPSGSTATIATVRCA